MQSSGLPYRPPLILYYTWRLSILNPDAADEKARSPREDSRVTAQPRLGCPLTPSQEPCSQTDLGLAPASAIS